MFEGAAKNDGQVLGGLGVNNLQEGRLSLETIQMESFLDQQDEDVRTEG